MTCIEKLKELKPWLKDLDPRKYIEKCCPHEFGIVDRLKGCQGRYSECVDCWNRKAKEDE